MNNNIKKVDDDLRGRERKNLHMIDSKKKQTDSSCHAMRHICAYSENYWYLHKTFLLWDVL